MSGENQYIQPTKKGTIQNNVIKNKKQYRLKIAKKKQKEKTIGSSSTLTFQMTAKLRKR